MSQCRTRCLFGVPARCTRRLGVRRLALYLPPPLHTSVRPHRRRSPTSARPAGIGTTRCGGCPRSAPTDNRQGTWLVGRRRQGRRRTPTRRSADTSRPHVGSSLASAARRATWKYLESFERQRHTPNPGILPGLLLYCSAATTVCDATDSSGPLRLGVDLKVHSGIRPAAHRKPQPRAVVSRCLCASDSLDLLARRGGVFRATVF